ncbi:MAG: glycosyltransferase family 2 protein [Candidatus Schekmanbacteria bacterium]|nr:MAG: glycosyltransferase family 2 protein [Candidatus Schekmanbacteria bacterium]
MREKLTALIPCCNEEENIRDCLESVKWADEIFVVDSFSNDRTVEIAKEYTSRVIQHEYINSATQKNWAIPQASNEWVLIVDSDERVTPDLRDEIINILSSNPRYDGYYIPRKNFFLGREVKYGGWGYENDLNIRLFRRDKGRYEDKEVHADIIIDGKVGRIKEPFLHYSYNSLEQYMKKMSRYTNWAAMDLCKKHKRIGVTHLLFRPFFTFLKMYVLKFGFLDGIRGIILAFLSSYYVYIKYAKAWEMINAENIKKPEAHPRSEK